MTACPVEGKVCHRQRRTGRVELEDDVTWDNFTQLSIGISQLRQFSLASFILICHLRLDGMNSGRESLDISGCDTCD
jgi:hypothetical protein